MRPANTGLQPAACCHEGRPVGVVDTPSRPALAPLRLIRSAGALSGTLRRAAFILLALVMLLCGGVTATGAFAATSRAAQQGTLDLRAADLARRGVLALDGEWEFYPGQLLSPECLHASEPPKPAGYLDLPTAWNTFAQQRIDGRGVATLRLQVLPPAQAQDLRLRVFDVHAAYRLWLDGRLIAARGTPGERPENEVADPAIDLPLIHSSGAPFELVLEISNHVYRDGGVTSSLLLGSDADIRLLQSRNWGVALFFVGSLLMMGCYHLFFYFFGRRSVAPLCFGLYCLLWAGNFAASNASDWVLRLLVPGLPIDWLNRFDSACFFLSVPVGYCFFRALFPGEFSPRAQQLSSALGAVFTVLALFAPLPTLHSAIPLYYFISLALIGYCVQRLAVARQRAREGASFILAGFAVLGLIATNDMLYDLQLIRSVYLIPVGMFFFIVAQGFALSLSFSRNFSAIERLSDELESRNRALEEEIAERVRLEREIVNVAENERRCLGHDLHDGLCQQLTAARLRCFAMEGTPAGSEQAKTDLAALSGLLEESVNVAYDLARGLWPVEHEGQGTSALLQEYCQRMAASHGVAIVVRETRACQICGNDDLIQLCRIAQEAVSNAVKHSRATRIEVSLDCASSFGTVSLRVRDDGIGREAASAVASPGGLGMRIMAHRARAIGGELQVVDVAGGGTEVRCKMPCQHCAQQRLPTQ